MIGKGDIVQEAPGALKVLHGGNKSSRSFTGPPKDYTNVIWLLYSDFCQEFL